MTLPDKATVARLQAAKDLLLEWKVISPTENHRIQSKLDKLANEPWTRGRGDWSKGYGVEEFKG